MKIERILCPVDFSPPSRTALEHAVALGARTHAEVVAMHTIEPIIYPIEYGMAPVPSVDLETTARQNAQKQLDKLLAEVSTGDVKTATKVVLGRAAESICEEAENGYDMVVLATHGRTGIRHFLLGSVAERVVRMSPCPVLTVKGEHPEE